MVEVHREVAGAQPDHMLQVKFTGAKEARSEEETREASWKKWVWNQIGQRLWNGL